MAANPKIKIAILRDLAHVPGGYLHPDDVLVANARLSVAPSPTRLEIEDAITELEHSGYIIGIRNDLTGERKWKITDAGKLALADM